MYTTHYASNPEMKAHFERIAKTGNVVSAIKFVASRGFGVLVTDIEVPFLTLLSRTEKSARAGFSHQFADELGAERAAINLITNLANRPRSGAPARDADPSLTAARLAGQATPSYLLARKEAWIRDRVAALEAEHFAHLKAEWTKTAIAEAAERFDAAPSAPAPTDAPEPPPARKSPRRAA
jgi:hypothetical protein